MPETLEDKKVKEIIAEIFRGFNEHNIPEKIGLSALALAYALGMRNYGALKEFALTGMEIALKTVYGEEDKND